MKWGEAEQILEGLFGMPAPRREKCKTLFEYAQRVPAGHAIVELGTAHGNGAIALALGAQKGGGRVFTVDDFAKRKGWATEPYGPEDEAIFTANCGKADVDVTLVKEPVEKAHELWFAPISLLYWDLGMFSGMARDFWNWEQYVAKGGKILVHDTYDRKLGSESLAQEAIETRRFRAPRLEGGGIWAFEKRPGCVFCVGMSRSGGTLQYLITRDIVERAGIGRGIGFGERVNKHMGSPDVLVLKVEALKPWAANMVVAEQADAVGISRDPRDVAASLMEFREVQRGFDSTMAASKDWKRDLALAIGWQKGWEKLPGILNIRYENARDNWDVMAIEIAHHLGINLSSEEAREIAEEWSIPKMQKRIEKIRDDGLWLGREWLLTRAHLGKQRGKIGRWERDLDIDEVRYVEALAGKKWMAEHGYRILDS